MCSGQSHAYSHLYVLFTAPAESVNLRQLLQAFSDLYLKHQHSSSGHVAPALTDRLTGTRRLQIMNEKELDQGRHLLGLSAGLSYLAQ